MRSAATLGPPWPPPWARMAEATTRSKGKLQGTASANAVVCLGAGGHWRLGQPARQVGEQPAVGVVTGDAPQVPHGAALPAAPPGSGRFPPRAAHRGGNATRGRLRERALEGI